MIVMFKNRIQIHSINLLCFFFPSGKPMIDKNVLELDHKTNKK